MPHKLDLGEVPSPYRLTFLVDLPEVFVVKQPFRPLLAGIGSALSVARGRPLVRSCGSSVCYHNKRNSREGEIADALAFRCRPDVRLLAHSGIALRTQRRNKERCESSGREAPRAIRSLRISLSSVTRVAASLPLLAHSGPPPLSTKPVVLPAL